MKMKKYDKKKTGGEENMNKINKKLQQTEDNDSLDRIMAFNKQKNYKQTGIQLLIDR